MRIAPIQQNNKTSFTSNGREVKDALGNVLNRNSTRFFRCDVNWDKFTDHIIKKYTDQSRVNVYCYACADGSEPYSLAMMLISKLGKEAKKFFPIIAKDIDDKFLDQARKGIVKLDIYDVEAITAYTQSPHTRFVAVEPIEEMVDNMMVCTGRVTEEVHKAVTFEQGDIVADIDNVQSDNSIVMFRNAWAYLNEDSRHLLAEKIAQRLNTSSMCVISPWDCSELRWNHLSAHGMQPEGFHCCYKKAAKNPQDFTTDPKFLLQTFARTQK